MNTFTIESASKKELRSYLKYVIHDVNCNGQLVFLKKNTNILCILSSFFPQVLQNIIMEYTVEIILAEYEFNSLRLKITIPDYNYYIVFSYTYGNGQPVIISTSSFHVCANETIDVFNRFMKKYYDKDDYFTSYYTEYYDEYYTKNIHVDNPRQFRHCIVMTKLVYNMIMKKLLTWHDKYKKNTFVTKEDYEHYEKN